MNLLRKKLVVVPCTVGLLAAILVYSWWVIFHSLGSAPNPNEKSLFDKAVLDPVKQKLIWDNEHITFEIEKRFGTAFLKALVGKNREAVQAFLLSDFAGEVITRQTPVTRKIGPLSEVRLDASLAGTKSATAAGLADYLVQSLAHFKKTDRKMLRVLQIQQIAGRKDCWKAKLLLGFVGLDQKSKRVLLESEHWIEFQIDDEMIIDRTACIKRWQMEYEVLRRSETALMEEVTKAYKLNDLPIRDNWKLHPTQVYYNRLQFAVADYNQDGFLDVAVSAVDQKPLLLESAQGKYFQEVAAQRGVTHPSSAAKWDFMIGWIDYDNDGYPDLLMNGRLYHNVGGKRFEDVTDKSSLIFDRECMGCAVVDYDCDGLLDLYVLYARDYGGLSRKQEKWVNDDESGQFNQLWRNEGNGRFRNMTERAKAGGGKRHTHAATWFFYDDDHYPDVYIANDFGQNVLLQNRGDGTFEDISAYSGAASFATSMGVVSGDVNNDGHSDLYVANMFSKMGRRIIGQLCDQDYPAGIFSQIKGSCAGNQLYLRQTAQAKFVDYSVPFGVNKVGWAYGPAMFDLNGDGWLDLYAATGFVSFERNEPDG